MNKNRIEVDDDYSKYRGKCKEFVDKIIKEDPALKAVRGYYYCPIWDTEEQHWWAEKPDGTIVDPTARQFPSKGKGIYTPFDGKLNCSECGEEMTEDKAIFESNYHFCSTKCYAFFVGLGEYVR